MISIDKKNSKEFTPKASESGFAKAFIERSILELSSKIAERDVLLAYSGGIASAVCAALLQRMEGVHLASVLVDFRLPTESDASEISAQYRKVFGENLEVLDMPDDLLNELEREKVLSERERILAIGLTDLIGHLARKRGIAIVGMGTTHEGIVAERRDRPGHHSLVHQPFGTDIDVVEPVSSLSREEVHMVGIELGLPSELTDSDHTTMSYL